MLLKNETKITWESFKVEYNRWFFPRAQRQLRAIDFQNLTQGSMTMDQYSAKFMELARFVANLIPDEESKAECFENGLNPRIKERVICHEIKYFARLVEVASLMEKGIRESAAAYDLKRRSTQRTSHPTKRLAIGSGSRPSVGKSFSPIVENQGPLYNKCGRSHVGNCRIGTTNCFKCGKFGHFSRNFPMNLTEGSRPQGGRAQQKYPAQAWVYSLTPRGVEDEEEYADVVTGIIP